MRIINGATNLRIQVFLDDGITPATGLVAGDFSTKKRAKQASAFGDFDTFTLTERAYGVYDVTCANTDTNTDGSLHVHLEGTGLDPVDKEFEIGAALATAAALATVQADTDDIQSRLPAALVSGRIDASVGAMAANVLTASAIATDAITAAKVADGTIDAATFAAGAINAAAIATNAIDADALASDAVTEIQSGLATSSSVSDVQTDVDNIQTRLPAALVGGRMDSSVGAVAADAITAAALAADVGTEIAAAVWAFAHEAGRTAKGVLVRLDALMTGKHTGLLGALWTAFRPDGSTKAIEATQDVAAGTRETASTIGGD